MKASFATLLMLLIAVPGQAQEAVHLQRGPGAPRRLTTAAPPPALSATDAPTVLHVTDHINRRTEAQQALETFHLQRATRPPVPLGASSRTAVPYTIGETRTFKVYNYGRSEQTSTLVMDQPEFTLMAQDDRFLIWVQSSELANGHVRDVDVEAMRQALSARTPAGSVNTAAGIIVNDETVFGNPPDVDGDSRTDVLLVDVQDGWEPGNGYIAGFVWYGDLGGSSGNNRDVLYLDTYPGLYRSGRSAGTDGMEATAAHEYQHLIHAAYDTGEITFVNEGLSEWAEVANGYFNRSITYLGKTSEHNVSLFDWRDDDINVVLNDYERAGLFTTYLAQRLGTAATGGLVQARRAGSTRNVPATGADGYDVALTGSGLTLADVVADFHTANFLNDRSANAAYGYEAVPRQSVHAASSRTFSGATGTTTRVSDLTVRPGAVQYLTWTGVSHFTFSADVVSQVSAALKPGMRTRLRLRAMARHQDGRLEVQDFAAGPETHTLSGDFAQVTLAVIHAAPAKEAVRLDVAAEWGGEGSETGETGVARLLAYDDGTALQGKSFALSDSEGGAQATRFSVPAGARLAGVSIAPAFLNQFGNSGQAADAPRDLVVKVWAAGADGKPGEELLSLPVADPRPFALIGTALSFFDVDLTAYEEQLSTLPATVFVGMAEAGSDANTLVVRVSSYATENVSFILGGGSWQPLWDVQFEGTPDDEYPVRQTAIPIRATFVVPEGTVAVDDEPELPAEVVLEQNYPNPFNPATAIRFTLPEAAHVRLAVFDALGRQVATLVDGVEAAGTHEARVDAATWPSGLYVYVLESGGRTQTKKMLLVK